MVNYKQGKIYKIQCHVTDKIYIGSTSQLLLSQRLKDHVQDYKKYKYKGRLNYVTSFEIIKNNNYSIILMESVPCETKNELHKRERYHIEKNVCVNKYVPLRTNHEYNIDNVQKTREYNEVYTKRPDVQKRNQEASKKYYSSEKGKAQSVYKDRMRRQWGDRYCNSLIFISWDVYK